jgi:S1-C subfamily serine protease
VGTRLVPATICGLWPRVMALVCAILLAPVPLAGLALAQIDPQVRDRVIPAVVQIAIVFDATERGATSAQYLPVGSGTVVSPDGAVLTNHHVVDMDAHQAQLDAWAAQGRADDPALAFALDRNIMLVLGTDGASPPEPRYVAESVAEDADLDLAVLRVTGDAWGAPLDLQANPLAYLPVGDSGAVQQGDPIDLWGYPAVAGGTLAYTAGVVSGFNFADGVDGPAWIITDATMSGGSSGGAALDRAGRLIGVPTQGSSLDCRPGDTNADGQVDARDVGCVPTGGSIGQVRPIALALPLLGMSPDPGTVQLVTCYDPTLPPSQSGECVPSHTDAPPVACVCPEPICLVAEWETTGPPRRLAVGPDGTVYAAIGASDEGDSFLGGRRSWPQAIHAFTGEGTLLRRWPELGSSDWGDGTYAYAMDVATTPSGDVVVLTLVALASGGYGPIITLEEYGSIHPSDTRIKVFDPTGAIAVAWGRDGTSAHEFGPRPVAEDVAPNGDVYVLDSSLGIVQRFGPNGDFLGAWGNDGSRDDEFGRPEGMAVGPDQSVYVVDTAKGQVKRFSPEGEPLGTWGATGSASGEFVSPSAIDVAPDGTIYVVDREADRTQRFTPDGTFLAQIGGVDLHIQDVAVAPSGLIYVAYALEDELGSQHEGNILQFEGPNFITAYCANPPKA